MRRVFATWRRHFQRRGESGQSVILLAIGFIALAAFVGITTDVSLAFVRYAQLSRAVDAASIAAANQMRQDKSLASVGLAARQFIEFHGLNPEQVWVDTCLTQPGDPELCTLDQSKLVRVRAFLKEPTVFMRLVGIPSFDLVAGAVSQTAALDVVVIMDVSESMLQDTTYIDWAQVEEVGIAPDSRVRKNYGVIYRPPRSDEILRRFAPTGQTPAQTDAWVASNQTAFWESWRTSAGNPANGLLNFPQVTINRRLTYIDARTGNEFEPNGDRLPQYRVLFDTQFFTNTTRFPDASWPAGLTRTATHPREECRVRFYPPSINMSARTRFNGYVDNTGAAVNLVDTYAHVGADTSNSGMPWPTSSNFLDGFVPNYRFYGCCNDPDGDTFFEDLNCQPFKQTRDAVFQFLERIDFVRGDRAAVVTFNRTAFLINPFGYVDATARANGDEGARPGAMLDSWQAAFPTVRDLVGVNAEPSFYVYTPGDNVGLSSRWSSYAAGINDQGQSIPVDYNSTNGYGGAGVTTDSTQLRSNPHIYNYPVWDNCSVTMATLRADRTPFDNGLANIALPNGMAVPSGYSSDGRATAWENFRNGNAYLLEDPAQRRTPAAPPGQRSSYNLIMSYERWATCRNGNVGAALREGNNALLNPRTTRRFGTIWIMVLLSDGAAGASDPVRRNGYKLRQADPYQFNTASSTWGLPGEYGSQGLCPVGTPTNPGELLTIANDAVEPSGTAGEFARFPYCTDEKPETRYTCDFRPLRTLDGRPGFDANALQDRDYNVTEDEAWNRTRGNLFDIDIGDSAGYGPCNILYDVDDYARDWADFISLDEIAGTASAQLPTVFTIGFGMEFTNVTRGDGTILVTDPTKKVNDPVNKQRAEEYAEDLCALNVSNCLGEQLLRYIADLGDNNAIDNDYYQDAMQAWYSDTPPAPGTGLVVNGFLDGSATFDERDRCQTQDVTPVNGTYDTSGNNIMEPNELRLQYGHLQPNVSCGNYYFAPNGNELQFVFDDIASRMFTRLAR